MQTSLTSYTGPQLNLDLYTSILSPEETTAIFDHLETTVPWPRPGSNRRVNQNYGDPGLSYRLQFGGYDGKPIKIIDRPVKPWEELPILTSLRDYVATITQSRYNYCVIQRYPNGRTGIKPHRDREMRAEKRTLRACL